MPHSSVNLSSLKRFFHRLHTFVRPSRSEQELARELSAHLTLIEDECRRRGMSPEEARLAARRALGGVDQVKERYRDARSFPWLEDVRRDIRYAWRALSRSGVFTIVAILTLALGIGATTAIFTVVHSVLLKPLPYPDADRIVRLMMTVPVTEPPVGRPRRPGQLRRGDRAELLRRTKTLTHVSFSGPDLMTLGGRHRAARLEGGRVSADYFAVYGGTPLIGRLFTAEDEVPGVRSVILSYRTWRRLFDGDPRILGQALTLDSTLMSDDDGTPTQYTVVGVMPEGFADRSEFWRALPSTSGGAPSARLADGVSLAAASAEVAGIMRELWKDRPQWRFELVSEQVERVAPVKPALLALMGVVAVVLLIACVNVANLLLARTAARQREIAIRVALGSGRGRVVRQLLTESLMLALFGGLAGILLAVGGLRLLTGMATTMTRMDLGNQLSLPRLDEIAVDGTVLAFAVGATLLTGVLCGLVPAFRHSRVDPLESLKQGAASSLASGFRLFRRAGTDTRSLLVIAETGMAMMLLVAGGLLLHSFMRLSRVELGYDPSRVLTFQVAVPADRYPGSELRNFSERLMTRLRVVPGIESAGYARQLPMVALKDTRWFRKTAEPPPISQRQPPSAPDARLVSWDYLDVMGIRVVAGRGFTEGDNAGRPRVMLINETLARREFPGENPIGRPVYAGRDEIPWEIVGIVADVRQFGFDQEPEPQFFADLRQWPGPADSLFPLGPYFAVRTAPGVSSAALTASLRGILQEFDRHVTLHNVATMDRIVANRITQPRLYAVLVGLFAGVAVLLAAIGLYGVMAYAVAQRTREIGIRMALGARRADVMGLVLRQSLVVTLLGVTLGLVGAALLTRYLKGMLFGLTPLDPATLVAVSLLFAVVAALASFVPARRATKVDPLVAFRHD